MKKLLIIFGAAFLFLGGLGFGAFGVAQASAADQCAVIKPSDLAALTSSQALSQELALRKQLLAQTISCATHDAGVLQATLTASKVGTADNAISDQLSGKIDDAINFYTIESVKLDGAGIAATETIAKEIIAWRAANYAPLAGDVNNFTLWEKNQGFFDTAQNRLAQTKRVVSFIESAATTNGDLETAFGMVQTALVGAQSENAAAGVAIAQIQLPDKTLALIQQSLQSLADAYKKFSDLNTQIQALLPTSNQ